MDLPPRVSPYRLKDASQIVWSDKNDETPIYPLEIVLAKSLPILEEEQEILALNRKEWSNLFEAAVIQAIENKSALDKVELFIPSIAVAAQRGWHVISLRAGPCQLWNELLNLLLHWK